MENILITRNIIKRVIGVFKDVNNFVIKQVNSLGRIRNRAVTLGSNNLIDIDENLLYFYDTSNKNLMLLSDKRIQLDDFDFSHWDSVNGGLGLFSNLEVNRIILDGIDTSNLIDIRYMFSRMHINDELIFKNLDLSNIRNATGIFRQSTIGKLVIDDVDLCNNLYLKGAFEKCNIKELIMHNINLSALIEANMLFRESNIEKISIDNIIMHSIRSLDGMCLMSKLGDLNLDWITDSDKSLRSCQYMLSGAYIDRVNLGRLDISNIKCKDGMFNSIHIKEIVMDTSTLESYDSSIFMDCRAMIIDSKTLDIKRDHLSHLDKDKACITYKLIKRIHKEVVEKSDHIDIPVNIMDWNYGWKGMHKGESTITLSKYGIVFETLDKEAIKGIKDKLNSLGNKIYYYLESDAIHVVSDKPFELLILPNNTRRGYKSGIFYDTEFKFIDLAGVSTGKLISLNYLFGSCKSQSIDLSGLIINSGVVSADSMFHDSTIDKVNIGSLDFSKMSCTYFINTSNIGNLISTGAKFNTYHEKTSIVRSYVGNLGNEDLLYIVKNDKFNNNIIDNLDNK